MVYLFAGGVQWRRCSYWRAPTCVDSKPGLSCPTGAIRGMDSLAALEPVVRVVAHTDRQCAHGHSFAFTSCSGRGTCSPGKCGGWYASSGQRHLPRTKINGQVLPTKEVETQETVNTRARRQGVSKDRKSRACVPRATTFSRMTRGANSMP